MLGKHVYQVYFAEYKRKHYSIIASYAMKYKYSEL